MSGVVRDWRCTAEARFRVIDRRYRLTPEALEALDALDAADPVVYATGPSGALTGLPVRPRCRRCRTLPDRLGECECPGSRL